MLVNVAKERRRLREDDFEMCRPSQLLHSSRKPGGELLQLCSQVISDRGRSAINTTEIKTILPLVSSVFSLMKHSCTERRTAHRKWSAVSPKEWILRRCLPSLLLHGRQQREPEKRVRPTSAVTCRKMPDADWKYKKISWKQCTGAYLPWGHSVKG